jgi:hypothetical protein
VWLYTIEPRSASPALLISASDDATVKDGTNKNANYDGAATLTVKNSSTSANARNAALINFALPVLYPPDLLIATLELQAATLTAPDTVQAHVYGVNNTNWNSLFNNDILNRVVRCDEFIFIFNFLCGNRISKVAGNLLNYRVLTY